MTLSPQIAIHMTFALSAVTLGPWVLWARMSQMQRPLVHRTLGYAWVTCMVGSAISALFIRGSSAAVVFGFSPIHLLIPLVFWSLYKAMRQLHRGQVHIHRKTMQWLYFLACVVTGLFTLLPQRLLGHWLWHDTLGWL